MKAEEYEPSNKRQRYNDGTNKAWEMMKGMGYKKDKGLGLKEQGRVEPVEAVQRPLRAGLGLMNDYDVPETKWVEDMDSDMNSEGDIIAKLDGSRLEFDKSDLNTWKVIGERKESLDGETNYCDGKLLEEMLRCKSSLDVHAKFLDARFRSNPYEKLDKGIFLNRAAMKMLNMDEILDGLFTNTGEEKVLYFADICAGPGGFTEYVLWKKPMTSCGFGFTLKGDCDFKLKYIVAGPVQCFHPSYGVDDTGDIFREENLNHFKQEVLNSTPHGLGVHLVMADGGFSVEGKENIQEIMSKQLYLCQFLCALNILRQGGNFVCKLFDIFTDFSAGLIYLVSTLFEETLIVKPITSRPANSERYIVFKQMNVSINSDHLDNIRQYLYSINSDLNKFSAATAISSAANNTSSSNSVALSSDNGNSVADHVTPVKPLDVIKLIPHNIIKRDHQFYQFIKEINNKILKQQIVALVKLIAFIKNPNLIDDERQVTIKSECYKRWGIENLKRDSYTNSSFPSSMAQMVDYKFNRFGLLKPLSKKPLNKLSCAEFQRDKFVVRNYYAAMLGKVQDTLSASTGISSDLDSNECQLQLLVKDKNEVLVYTDQASVPTKASQIYHSWLLQLPSYTMLYIHFAKEYGGLAGKRRCNTIVVADALVIYGNDIHELSYPLRMESVSHMCHLLDPKLKGFIRPIDFFPLINLPQYIKDNVSHNCKQDYVVKTRQPHKHEFSPEVIICINNVKYPWMIAHSKSARANFYYNVETAQKIFDKPDDCDASYCESHIYSIKYKSDKPEEFDYSKMASLWNRKNL